MEIKITTKLPGEEKAHKSVKKSPQQSRDQTFRQMRATGFSTRSSEDYLKNSMAAKYTMNETTGPALQIVPYSQIGTLKSKFQADCNPSGKYQQKTLAEQEIREKDQAII